MDVPTQRTRAARRIAADPTSTALLLAGPTAFALWPGVRRLAEVAGRTLVEFDADRPTAATVRAEPPRRTPTSYVCRFDWSGPDLPATRGVLTLMYADRTPIATAAELVLDSTDLPGSALDRDGLARLAAGFLLNLARAAEERSRAA